MGAILEVEAVEVEVGTTAADEAWWAGYGLGWDQEHALPPSGCDAAERAAWLDGYEAGHCAAWSAMAAEYEAWADAIDPDPFGECRGSQVGHDAA